MKVKSLSRVRLFATLQIVTRQASLSMEFSKQEYWTGCHFLLQGTFPTQGSHPRLLHQQAGSLPLSYQGSPAVLDAIIYKNELWVHFLWKFYCKVEGLGQNWASHFNMHKAHLEVLLKGSCWFCESGEAQDAAFLTSSRWGWCCAFIRLGSG